MNTPIEFSSEETASAPRLARLIPPPFQAKPALTGARLDIRILWLIPLVLLFAALVMGAESAGILWSALAAATSCLIALAAVGYRPTSFVAIVALYHLVVYPLAAWGNLLLPEPAVREDLWIDTAQAMQGCAVGILALALGAWIANYSVGPKKLSVHGSTSAAPNTTKSSILIALLIIPVALIWVRLGAYYHITIAASKISQEVQAWANLISIMQSIAYSGIFLLVYRYSRTRSMKDACWSAALVLLCILIFLPSGMRGAAYGFLPLLLLAFSEWEPDQRRKIVVIGGCIVLMLSLTYGVGAYRSLKGVDQVDLEEKYKFIINSTLNLKSNQRDPWTMVIGRISDYVAAGRIIAVTPEKLDFRGAESLESLWQIFVPGFLHILPERINLADAGELCDRYGITKAYKGYGSSPCMIIGDLYSRWGWPGIFLGMIVFGFILRQFDIRIFYRWDTFTIIFFALMARLVFSIGAQSLIQLCVTLFRDSLVMAAIAYFLALVIEPKKNNP